MTNAPRANDPLLRRGKKAIPQANRRSKQSPKPISLRPRGKVEKFPSSRPAIPAWLRSLLVLQRTSNAIAFILVATTLSLYGWTVYTQQMWSREYRKLETLQRNERGLTATSEVLKNKLAAEAEKPETGLVHPTPAHTIFLPPAPQRSIIAPTPIASPDPDKMPMGY